jgi:hypothetical protein
MITSPPESSRARLLKFRRINHVSTLGNQDREVDSVGTAVTAADGHRRIFLRETTLRDRFDDVREDRYIILRESRLPSEWLPGATRLTSRRRISVSRARNKLALSSG